MREMYDPTLRTKHPQSIPRPIPESGGVREDPWSIPGLAIAFTLGVPVLGVLLAFLLMWLAEAG